MKTKPKSDETPTLPQPLLRPSGSAAVMAGMGEPPRQADGPLCALTASEATGNSRALP